MYTYIFMSMPKNKINESSIKQDLNLLDNPLWIQDEKSSWKYRDERDNLFKWEIAHNGRVYKLKTLHTPPTRLDIVVKYFLLGYSQYHGWTRELNDLTIYQVLRGCDWNFSEYYYKRVIEALKRWANLVVEFDGSLYDKGQGKHVSKTLHVLNYEHKEDGRLHITLDDKWLDLIKESLHYQIFDFKAYKQMSNAKDPLAMRLYEILCKKFLTSSIWPIDLQLLALKCGTEHYYPSRFKPKIRRAVKNLNSMADMSLEFEMRKHDNGTTVFFKNTAKIEEEAPRQEDSREWNDILAMIPQRRATGKKNMARLYSYYKKLGVEAIKNSIKYVNRMRVSRYWPYLFETIKNEYWRDMLPSEEKDKDNADEKEARPSQKNQGDKSGDDESFRAVFRGNEQGAELLRLARWRDTDVEDIIIENYLSKGRDFCEGVLRLTYGERPYNSKQDYIDNLRRLFSEKTLDELPVRSRLKSGGKKNKKSGERSRRTEQIDQQRVQDYIDSLSPEETEKLVDEALEYVKERFGPLIHNLCLEKRNDPFSESNLKSAMEEIVRRRLAAEDDG